MAEDWGCGGISVPQGGPTQVSLHRLPTPAPGSSRRRPPFAQEHDARRVPSPRTVGRALRIHHVFRVPGRGTGSDGVPRFKGGSERRVISSKAHIPLPLMLILRKESFTRPGGIVFAGRPAKSLQTTAHRSGLSGPIAAPQLTPETATERCSPLRTQGPHLGGGVLQVSSFR